MTGVLEPVATRVAARDATVPLMEARRVVKRFGGLFAVSVEDESLASKG